MITRGLLSLITFSEKRSGILIMASEKPITLDEIKEHFNVSSPEILPQIKKLEDGNLLVRNADRTYELTDIGRVVSKPFLEFCETIDLFEEDMEFWLTHDVQGIPDEFLYRLKDIGKYHVVRSSPTNIFEPHEEFMSALITSKKIRGVSPIFHPEYPAAFEALAAKGKQISLIISASVYERIKVEHQNELQIFLDNSELMVYGGDIGLAFTVTDSLLSLGLFDNRGVYDTNQDLMSYEKSALKWGDDLFKYFKKQSRKV